MKHVVTVLLFLTSVAWPQTKQPAVTSAAQDSIVSTSGVPSSGFPQWSERVLLEWTNRARSDPQYEMTQCGSACGDAACYQPTAPLWWSLALNRSARFHSDEMLQQGYFAHDSACTLVSNISNLYPPNGTCNGAASCACVGGTKACSPPSCTTWSSRIALFGSNAAAENIAASSDPNSAFYLWLYENYPTSQTPPNCHYDTGPPATNGHRWNLLMQNGGVGFGVDGYAVADFSGGVPDTSLKIPSGAHYPQQGASVSLWANWYDTSAPLQSNLVVDGWPVALTRSRGTDLNGVWSTTLTNVASGCHRYYFDFKDSTGATVQYPDTGSFAVGTGSACPDYSASRPTGTTTALSSSAASIAAGAPVTFTATVTPASPGTPTGSVTFFDGTTNLATVALNASGQASFTTSTLALGSHTMTAGYSGDATYAPSTSSPLTETIVPGIGISPSPVNFTAVAVGTKTAAVKVTVTNHDTTAITVNSVSVTGTNSSDFVISGTTCTSGLNLAPGKSCTVNIYFHPSLAGGRTADLTVNDTGPSNPQTAHLNGTGLNVFFSPASVNYGTQLIGSSTVKKLTLKNTSTSALSINAIATSGDYAVASQTCGTPPTVLAAGANCAISVAFQPTAMNLRSGTLSVGDNGIGSPQTANLTGMGTYMSYSPAAVSFGTVVQGSTSTQNVTLTNHNTVTVNLTNISIKGTSDFSVLSGSTTCGTSVPAGQSCVIGLQFTAGVLGNRSASLSVSDSGGGSPQLVKLTATSAIHPVINEFKTAGTAGGGDEFIELYNPNSFAFKLGGYSLVYRSASAVSDTVIAHFATSKSIPAHGYFLVAGPAFTGVSPDITYSTDTLAVSAGGIAIRDPNNGIVDSVGYGATSNFVETAAAPVPPSGQSASRIPNGTDTNNNSADFSITAVPTPKASN